MVERALHVVIRTPRQAVVDVLATSLRVPTPTGHVGLRPRSESVVLAVEPGLILIRVDDRMRFVASAGGLLDCDGAQSTLLTPIAVAGESSAEVLESLERALAQPSDEMEARAALGRLESSILRELRDDQTPQRHMSKGGSP